MSNKSFFILGPDIDHQQISMKVTRGGEVTSYSDTSQENIDISIIESTCLNIIYWIFQMIKQREKRVSTQVLWPFKFTFLVPSLKLFFL